MWELNYKESWAPKNWCFWAVVLEKTLESPLDSKEIQLVHPKGNQPWIFIGRSDVGAETPILWPPDVKNWLTVKTPDAGKDLKAGGEGDDRGWDGWMASVTQWTWVWINFGNWWWTGRPGVLQSMGSQRVRLNWATKLNWTELRWVDVRGEVNMVEGQVNRENTEAKKEMLIRSEGCRDRLWQITLPYYSFQCKIISCTIVSKPCSVLPILT